MKSTPINPRFYLHYFMVFAIMTAGLAAQNTKTGLTSADIAKLTICGAAEISPNGKNIAFRMTVPRKLGEPDGPAYSELWVIPHQGGEARALVEGKSSVSAPRWSADSTKVYFTSRRRGDQATTLYQITLDGGKPERVFTPKGSIRTYDLTSDGKKIAYTCASKKVKTPTAALGFDQVLYAENIGDLELHCVDLDQSSHLEIPVDGAAHEVMWNAAGDRLALWVAPTSLTDDRYMQRRLSVWDAKSNKLWQLVANPGKVGQFSWSPKGNSIAYISGVDINDPKESTLMLAELGEVGEQVEGRVLTDATNRHVMQFAWNDDLSLSVLVAQGCSNALGFQALDGSPFVQIALDKEVLIKSFSLARDSKNLAMIAEGQRFPAEVFAAAASSAESPKRLTHHNTWLAERDFGKQEVIRYKARDGLEIEAVLIHPVIKESDKDAKSTPRPLILQVHGGPEAHYSNGFLTGYNMPGQMAAARGYYLLYQNYRGSTGRGVEFSKADQGRMAKEEFDDLVDGVDYLVAKKLVDRDRVGITGGSYGGYASAWGATYYSERFAAAVMFVGISEQISKVLTTDIPNESYYSHWQLRPWDDWQKFLEASPVYYIKKAQTPILIAHGEKDPRVPVKQSIELYRALKIKGGVPTRLVVYPREGHGNRAAAARLDYSLRQMRWFDHFLMKKAKSLPNGELDYGLNK